jgi:hypothetical protein
MNVDLIGSVANGLTLVLAGTVLAMKLKFG